MSIPPSLQTILELRIAPLISYSVISQVFYATTAGVCNVTKGFLHKNAIGFPKVTTCPLFSSQHCVIICTWEDREAPVHSCLSKVELLTHSSTFELLIPKATNTCKIFEEVTGAKLFEEQKVSNPFWVDTTSTSQENDADGLRVIDAEGETLGEVDIVAVTDTDVDKEGEDVPVIDGVAEMSKPGDEEYEIGTIDMISLQLEELGEFDAGIFLGGLS